MKRLPNGVDRPVVLPAPRPRRRCRPACASRRCPTTTCRRGSIGGVAQDAALHGAAGVDLDGPVLLDARRAAHARPGGHRPRPAAGRDLRPDPRRRPLGPRGPRDGAACPASPRPPGPRGCTSSSRWRRARRTRPGCSSARSWRRWWRPRIPRSPRWSAPSSKRKARHDLRRLPAEHRGQDAGLRLQRPRPAPSPACRRRSTWDEVHDGVRPEDFTIDTVIAARPRRGRPVGRPARATTAPDLLGGARKTSASVTV